MIFAVVALAVVLVVVLVVCLILGALLGAMHDDLDNLRDNSGSLRETLDALRESLRSRIADIHATLPKTADNIPVIPGDVVYSYEGPVRGVIERIVTHYDEWEAKDTEVGRGYANNQGWEVYAEPPEDAEHDITGGLHIQHCYSNPDAAAKAGTKE